MKIQNLSFSYGDKKILDNLNFKVIEKEMLGIVGDSGTGKSTLLRLMGNLIPIQSGIISNHSEIGFIFQNFNLFPHLNVLDNLCLALRLNKDVSKNQTISQANELLREFGILEKAKSFIDQLSGGEKQRVAITRALMLKPKILLIDEATSSLDPNRRIEFMNILNDLKKDGMTVVIVSHDHEILNAYCDKLIFLKDGKIEKIEKPTTSV